MKFKLFDKVRTLYGMEGVIVQVGEESVRVLFTTESPYKFDFVWYGYSEFDYLKLISSSEDEIENAKAEGKEEAFQFIKKMYIPRTEEFTWYMNDDVQDYSSDKWKLKRNHKPEVGDVYKKGGNEFIITAITNDSFYVIQNDGFTFIMSIDTIKDLEFIFHKDISISDLFKED